MFAQWLALFEATAAALFTPDLAGAFVAKARRIALSLELAVFHRLGASPDGLRASAGLAAGSAPPAPGATPPCD